jgi:hypothetical protein
MLDHEFHPLKVVKINDETIICLRFLKEVFMDGSALEMNGMNFDSKRNSSADLHSNEH